MNNPVSSFSSLAHLAASRHSAKAFDSSRKISAADIAEIRRLLQLAPSSVNSQPWHFVMASSKEGIARVAKATEGAFSYNLPKVRDASHVIVLCTRTAIHDAHLQALLAQEAEDGRFRDEAARAGQEKSRLLYSDIHRYDYKDAQHWMEKQVYLALGTLLLGAAALGIDACPMEGFDAKGLDAELDLHRQGFSSTVLVALGYRSEQDFNAGLPKSRLSQDKIFTDL